MVVVVIVVVSNGGSFLLEAWVGIEEVRASRTCREDNKRRRKEEREEEEERGKRGLSLAIEGCDQSLIWDDGNLGE